MQNIKLFLILKSLTDAEIKELGKFVSSPFHNKNKTLIKFYNLLKKRHPDYASRTLEMEYMYKKLFSSKTYIPGVMRNLVSEMIRITEDYLAFIEFRKNRYDYYRLLLKQLKSKKIEKLFKKSLNDAYDYLNKIKIRDEDYYYHSFILGNINREFEQEVHTVGKRKLLYDNIPRNIENLKYAFLIAILKEYFSLYNIRGLYNLEYPYKFLDEIMEHVSNEEEEFKKVPMIYILYTFLSLLLKGKNEKQLPQLKKMIDENREIMTNSEYKDFYMELYNYYKDKQEAGDKNAGRTSFEITKEMFEKNIYLQPGETMSAHGYVNVCVNAARIRELKWAEEFTIKYKQRLHPNQQENAFLYNMSSIYFIKGNDAEEPGEKEKHYRKALEYLSKVKSEDYYYMTRIKNLLIMIHYQLNEFEVVLNIITNYKQYLLKNKSIPRELVDKYQYFAAFMLRIINARLKSDYAALLQVKNELAITPKASFKVWMTKKINELEYLLKENN